jgi:hippurate hydrolase
LQLTVRSTTPENRKTLLDGIRRIARNMGRVAGLPADKLPEVSVSEESVPPTNNDAPLARRLRESWQQQLGDSVVIDRPSKGMGAEDFTYFTSDPDIPSVYWAVGGTPAEAFAAERNGGEAVPSHHSPLFKIAPEPSIRRGVESTVVALMTLLEEPG